MGIFPVCNGLYCGQLFRGQVYCEHLSCGQVFFVGNCVSCGQLSCAQVLESVGTCVVGKCLISNFLHTHVHDALIFSTDGMDWIDWGLTPPSTSKVISWRSVLLAKKTGVPGGHS